MHAEAATVTPKPEHVPETLVMDFDIYHDPRLLSDVHAGYRQLQLDAPDVFWTRHNGGHWMITRHDLIQQVMRDFEHFSNKELEVPKTESPFVAIPINLDPPEHTTYRIMLSKHFGPKVVAGLDAKMREWANRLIDRVYDRGEVDFAEALGASFPVSIFMEMAGMPLDRLEDFRLLVKDFFGHHSREYHVDLQRRIVGEMEAIIDDRIANRRDDLVSRLVDETVQGRPLSRDELKSILLLLFLAGLDTVANAMTFAFRNLAERPDLQERLRSDPTAIPNFVEESLRRFAIVNGVRLVKQDVTLGGVEFRKGDMIIAPLTLVGLDDRANPDPAKFDVDRAKRQHLTFSTGPHICLGHYLARAEMRVFVEEFLRRIPQFRIQTGYQPHFRAGLVMALENLPLEWPVERRAEAA